MAGDFAPTSFVARAGGEHLMNRGNRALAAHGQGQPTRAGCRGRVDRGFGMRRALPAAVASLCIATPSYGETAASIMTVGATVTSNCTIKTGSLGFGTLDPSSGSDGESSGAVAVTCTNGTSWTASLVSGSGSTASAADRRMINGEYELSYALYRDPARRELWGDGAEAGTYVISGTGSGSPQPASVYGRIAAGQRGLPAGSYSDALVVTISY